MDESGGKHQEDKKITEVKTFPVPFDLAEIKGDIAISTKTINKPTILTVSYNSWNYLWINYKLLEKNAGRDFDLIVINNKPSCEEDKRDTYYLLNNKKNVTIIDGVERDLLVRGLNTKKGGCSVHHAFGLNLGIKYCKSDFLIILDPDFFILRTNWINDIISFMMSENKVFLGVTWAPKYPNKWSDFPSNHFECFDTRSIDKNNLNFMPRHSVNDKYEKGAEGDTSCRIRDFALENYSSEKWSILDSCSKIEFFNLKPQYIEAKSPIIKVDNLTTNLDKFKPLMEVMDFWLWQEKRFGIHMRNGPKGLTDLDSLSDNSSKYIIACMNYLVQEAFD